MDFARHNWDTFCRYHAGDWHGSWTQYALDGVALASFQCIRSFHVTADGSAITHQNHYRYADGRQETKTFGPYTPATTRSLFVETSFSWGAPAVTGEIPFFFETGFRAAERRVSLVARYDARGVWQPILVMTEHRGRLAEPQPAVGSPALPQGCQGLRRTMTPDRRVAAPEPVAWSRLEALGEDTLTVRVPEGLAVSLPHHLAPGQPFVGIVEWVVRPTVVQRGLRYYQAWGFSHFSFDRFPAASSGGAA
jgi:hypothetical protein